MLKTKCLECGCDLMVDSDHEGDGYFFGYDTDYYGDTVEDMGDPHNIIGHYCKMCGAKLRQKAEGIRWERID